MTNTPELRVVPLAPTRSTHRRPRKGRGKDAPGGKTKHMRAWMRVPVAHMWIGGRRRYATFRDGEPVPRMTLDHPLDGRAQLHPDAAPRQPTVVVARATAPKPWQTKRRNRRRNRAARKSRKANT